MTIFKRHAALLGLLAFAAACGGGDAPPAETAQPEAPTAEAPAAPVADPAATPAAGGTVHQVTATTTQNGASGTFEPATLTVKQGDVIRFTSTGAAVHNVSFPAAENAGKTGLPADSPFLADGQTYDLQVTMAPGTYSYVCTPHLAMGMRGTITVE